jgi:hypothetical protein
VRNHHLTEDDPILFQALYGAAGVTIRSDFMKDGRLINFVLYGSRTCMLDTVPEIRWK